MATLTVQATTTAGVVPAAPVAAAAGGDQFPNTGNEALEVVNGGASPVTVTIASQRLCDQGSVHNTVVSVPNGTTSRIGPFNPTRYNDANGNVQITYSAVTSVTVRAYSV